MRTHHLVSMCRLGYHVIPWVQGLLFHHVDEHRFWGSQVEKHKQLDSLRLSLFSQAESCMNMLLLICCPFTLHLLRKPKGINPKIDLIQAHDMCTSELLGGFCHARYTFWIQRQFDATGNAILINMGVFPFDRIAFHLCDCLILDSAARYTTRHKPSGLRHQVAPFHFKRPDRAAIWFDAHRQN